jgi:uncharacterized protein (DUF58 family)
MVATATVATQWFDPAAAKGRAGQDAAAADLASRTPRLVARAREVAASIIHGAHGRRRAGVGETFWQYRPAVAGEPAQRIDWRRSARSDQLYVRELEWEAARSFYLWMDASPSMAFKSSLAQDFKIDRAALLGLALADVLVRGGERVAALGLGPPIAARDIIERLARALIENLDTIAGWELAPLVAVPARAKIVLISDFLCDPGELAARLMEFADAGACGALLMIVDPAEESFPFAGETRFLDTDGGAPFHAGEARRLREAYSARLAEHREAVREAAKRAGFLFLLHHTDRPAAEAALNLTLALASLTERRRWD